MATFMCRVAKTEDEALKIMEDLGPESSVEKTDGGYRITAPLRRRTSLYVLTVPAYVDANLLADAMVQKMASNPKIQRAGLYPRTDRVIAMFRTTDDATAIAAAETLGGNTHGSMLHTGLGVHRRNVASA